MNVMNTLFDPDSYSAKGLTTSPNQCSSTLTSVDSVNSFCEQNSVHGPLPQHAACAMKEINGS